MSIRQSDDGPFLVLSSQVENLENDGQGEDTTYGPDRDHPALLPGDIIQRVRIPPMVQIGNTQLSSLVIIGWSDI